MINFEDEFKKSLRLHEAEERLNHVSSGKMNASNIGSPIQEQVLKLIGIPPKPFDDYTLGLFLRGRSTEQDIVDNIPEGDTQGEVLYRGVVGKVDYEHKKEVAEIKSLKSSQYRYLSKEGAKRGHKLQACVYALGRGYDNFTVVYAVSDDYRILQFTYPVAEYKPEVDMTIDSVEKALKSGKVPPFVAIEKWQSNPMYAKFPDWVPLNQAQLNKKLKTEFPDAYKRLKDWGKSE